MREIRTCYYCPSKDFPHGKPIGDDDLRAVRTAKGWKCTECIKSDLVKVLALNDPEAARKYQEREQTNKDEWNMFLRQMKRIKKQ